MCQIWHISLLNHLFLESCPPVPPESLLQHWVCVYSYVSSTWGLKFFNSPTTPQSANMRHGVWLSEGLTCSSFLKWISYFPVRTILINGIRRWAKYLLLTFWPSIDSSKMQFSMSSDQEYLTWLSICTKHMRDKLCLFITHHKAVAKRAMHHSALASNSSLPPLCFLWDCSFQ